MFDLKLSTSFACLPLAALLVAAAQGGSCGGGGAAARNGQGAPQTNARGRADKAGEKMNENRRAGESRVAAGSWGGEHVRLEVGDGGAEVEFDCAHGSIEGPLKLDASGRFEAPGTLVFEGGPASVPADGQTREGGFPARYRGRVDGDRMTLSVTVPQTGATIDDLTLTRGRPPRLEKCF